MGSKKGLTHIIELRYYSTIYSIVAHCDTIVNCTASFQDVAGN